MVSGIRGREFDIGLRAKAWCQSRVQTLALPPKVVSVFATLSICPRLDRGSPASRDRVRMGTTGPDVARSRVQEPLGTALPFLFILIFLQVTYSIIFVSGAQHSD